MNYIYKITNLINNKSYIGFTTDPKARWEGHRHNQGSKLVFQAIKKYGVDNFEFKVIAEDTIKNEQKYIDKYNAIAPHGYNINIGGDLPPNHKGKTYREIYGSNWKEQIAKRMKTKKQNKNFGGVRKHSVESKAKISKALAGKNHPQWGKPLSDKRKRNISKARKGQFAGAKSPTAKKWRLISPDGNTHTAHGNLREVCKNIGISFATVHASHLYNRPMRSGWRVETQ